MKKVIYSCLALALMAVPAAQAQIYTMKDATIGFFSDAVLEDIAATNAASQGVVNFQEKSFSFRIPIKSFKFERELMQEHFNENYMESEKYPYGTFKGSIEGAFDIAKDGDYSVSAVGTLNIHGVDSQRTIPTTIHVSKGNIAIDSKFMVKLADHKIEIPTIVFQKIAEEVEVSVSSALVVYKK
ncbi:MAG: YceI family protein [Imperialibacter sp.]|uniref:YceI family protein n=1 Tax=Imperialibacter sp. TaxID=2038411 RepID=UPI0032EDCA91